jgi:hypothetical protein
MSLKPTARRADVQRLLDEGYEVDQQHGYLLVHSVPYVTPAKTVELGTLISAYADEGKPADHTVWFRGETPCSMAGNPLNLVIIESQKQVLFDRFEITHRFSNKKTDVPDFPADYFVKIEHYVSLLEAHARALEPNADARTGRPIRSREENPIHVYPDSGAIRAGIVAIGQKLELRRIAIVGLGGTGGYVLDQATKTRVREIHLFDGDYFKRNNAFRAPGAASFEALEARPRKVDYFAAMYSKMHKGIIPHPFHLTEANVAELAGYDFVFICVDDGPTRGLLSKFLACAAIPFVDVGMGIEKGPSGASLLGICRTTLGSPAKWDHLTARLPVADDRDEAIYRNIQVSEINALNAMFAVIKWKQFFGFYEDYEKAHNLSFSVAMLSLVRDDRSES